MGRCIANPWIDRRHLPVNGTTSPDPASTRHVAQIGDFQLESLRLEDVLLTIYQPDFRPYTASIFSANLAHFRKQWMFYDLISAENMVGQFDNCLFSVHRPQSIDRTMGGDIKDASWRRMVSALQSSASLAQPWTCIRSVSFSDRWRQCRSYAIPD